MLLLTLTYFFFFFFFFFPFFLVSTFSTTSSTTSSITSYSRHPPKTYYAPCASSSIFTGINGIYNILHNIFTYYREDKSEVYRRG